MSKINPEYCTNEEVGALLKFISDSKGFNYNPFVLSNAISILCADEVRNAKYVTYPPYGCFCTIRQIIDLYNDALENE